MNYSPAPGVGRDFRETLGAAGYGIEITSDTIDDAFILVQHSSQRARIAAIDARVLKNHRSIAATS
jgi:hypothetical protein